MNIHELAGIKHQLEDVITKIDDIIGENVIPFNKMTIHEQEDYIIEGACAFWGVSPKNLMLKTDAPRRTRKYLCVLLEEYTNTGREKIASMLHYKEQSTVTHHIRDMEEKLSDKPWGDTRMRAIYGNLVKHLGLPPSKYLKDEK